MVSVPAATAEAAAAAPGQSATEEQRPSFIATCKRCHSTLRIVDDLPATADVFQSFRGTISDSFVVVPTTDPQEFIEGRSGGGLPSVTVEGAAGQQLHVADFDQVLRIEKIMALASGQSEADHPVCAECLEKVVTEVKRQVDQAEEEQREYREAHARLDEELRSGGQEEASRLEAELVEMEAEERRLVADIAACDREEAQLGEELEAQARQEEQLSREEEDFWLAVAEHQLDLEESEEERAATASAIQYATEELRRLKRTNVLNDMFHISQDGPFGTISRFRIGRLPEQPVAWDEINAAWGQACLLLDALVRKCGVPMTQYKLLPRGNYSAIQAGNDTLELYSSDGGLTRFFSDRRFDWAMSAFLGCLNAVTRFLSRDPTMRLPFKIENDKVGGFSVRVQFNQDERWTKALKFMLTDLKWIIAFVESREFNQSNHGPGNAA